MYSQTQEEAADVGATAEASAEPALAEGAPAAAPRPTTLESLKAEIARAMQVAADRERERIDASMGDEETAQVEKIVTRAAAEAAELSKHADEDVSVVNAWYKDQVKQIRAEADRKIDDRRLGLEQSLTIHRSLIEAEVESVHLAVEGYRGSLGAFFGRMAEERDPSAIARLAGDLPDPPRPRRGQGGGPLQRDAGARAARHGRATPPGGRELGQRQRTCRDRPRARPGHGPRCGRRDGRRDRRRRARDAADRSAGRRPRRSRRTPIRRASTRHVAASEANGEPEGVAVRLKRAITSWTSTTGAPQDH